MLPNAPFNPASASRAWYQPKALPNSLKPRVPGQEDEEAAGQEPDDEDGILRACDLLDAYVAEEIEKGTPNERIVVGGFSQGCAISLVWGVIGKQRNNVAGVVCCSGYFPLAERIAELRRERGIEEGDKDSKKWFYIHGSKDILVPTSLFTRGKEELGKWIGEGELEEHLYEGMGHSTNNNLLRDLLGFLTQVVPP